MRGGTDLLAGGDEVHGAAHALDGLTRDHPAGQVSIGADLQGTEDGQVDVTAADHREGLGGGEGGAAGEVADGLLARVDQVGVHVLLVRIRTDAQQTVLRLQHHVHPLGDEVAADGGDADAEVDVHAVLKLLSSSDGDAISRRLLRLLGSLRGGEVVAALVLLVLQDFHVVLVGGALGDALLELLALDDALHVDARQVDLVGLEHSVLHDLLHLGHRDLGRLGALRVEVAGGAAEDEVAGLVGFPGLHAGEVSLDRLLEDVLLPVELLHVLGLAVHLDLAVFRHLQGKLPLLDDSAVAGGRVESWDARPSCAELLGQSSLWCEDQFELTSIEQLCDLLVLSDIRGVDSFHLVVVRQETETEVLSADVIGDDGEVFGAFLVHSSNKVLRNTTDPETSEQHGRAIFQVVQGFHGILVDFIAGASGEAHEG